MASLDCINLHLIGKRGSGKSTAGNFILDKKVFMSSTYLLSNTLAQHKEPVPESMEVNHYSLVNTNKLRLWDWPGMDQSQESMQAITDSSRKLAKHFTAETHLILWVLRYGELCNEEDEGLLTIFTTALGETAMAQNTIILLTHKDNFERDVEETQLTFNKWLNQQGGFFQRLLQMCKGRVLFFDNRGKHREELNDFFVLISSMLLNKAKQDLCKSSQQSPLLPPTDLASVKDTLMESEGASCVESAIDELCRILESSCLSKTLEMLTVLFEKMHSRNGGRKQPVTGVLMREIGRQIEELTAVINRQTTTCTYIRNLKENHQHEANDGGEHDVVEKEQLQFSH